MTLRKEAVENIVGKGEKERILVSTWIWLLLATTSSCVPVSGITMRRIYTLFTDERTWNEANEICSDQYGQLVKIKSQTEIYELISLDQTTWGHNLTTWLNSGLSFWSGHHRPLTNSNDVKYQDCEDATPQVTISVDNATCGSYNSSYSLSMSPCNQRKIFICERYEGDCWYEPIVNEQSAVDVPDMFQHTDLPAVDCAMICRNHSNQGYECWAFLFQHNPSGTPSLYCMFYSFNNSFVATSGAPVSSTSASAYYSNPANRVPTPATTVDLVFYIRRCFEGSLDLSTYSHYLNNGFFAETECATKTLSVNNSASDICFCATEEQPPIPKPISSEAKAEELVKELTIEASNTSAAQRKKTSAEDNRPSAIGVGYVGVGIMVGVFGGLLLMDVSLLIKGLRHFFNPVKTESTA